jgi:hypothetical protein
VKMRQIWEGMIGEHDGKSHWGLDGRVTGRIADGARFLGRLAHWGNCTK